LRSAVAAFKDLGGPGHVLVLWNANLPVRDAPGALKHPAVEVTVPLARNRALHAWRKKPLAGDVPLTAKDLNKRTFSHAERFVYSPVPFEMF
jgi:hypothetical protein